MRAISRALARQRRRQQKTYNRKTFLANNRIVAVLQLRDKVVCIGTLGSGNHVVIARRLTVDRAQQNVLFDGARKENRLLRDERDTIAQLFDVVLLDRHAVDQNLAAAAVVEALQ
jgi:hypothetical protein